MELESNEKKFIRMLLKEAWNEKEKCSPCYSCERTLDERIHNKCEDYCQRFAVHEYGANFIRTLLKKFEES